MKQRALALCLAGAVVLALAGCGGDKRAEPTSTVATPRVGAHGPILPGLTAGRQAMAPDGRYTLLVPAEWIEINAGLAEVSFRAPDLAAGMSVSVTRESLAGTRQPQVYAEAGRRAVSNVYANVVTLSMTPVQVGEMPAYRWVYTATVAGRDQFFYQLFLIDGGEGFVVTGNAPSARVFSEMQALFDSIAGSMSFARG